MKRGFPLIELLVVIAIIAVLSAIVLHWLGTSHPSDTVVAPDKCLAAVESDYPGYENYTCSQGWNTRCLCEGVKYETVRETAHTILREPHSLSWVFDLKP